MHHDNEFRDQVGAEDGRADRVFMATFPFRAPVVDAHAQPLVTQDGVTRLPALRSAEQIYRDH